MSEPRVRAAVAADLRRALTRAGTREGKIDAFATTLQPVVAAVKRAGARIDSEVCRAHLAAEADRPGTPCAACAHRRMASSVNDDPIFRPNPT